MGEIKQEYSRSTYAQFAALHLGRLAVQRGDLATAEAELRWVLGRADKGSDTAQLAQLRLARVLASGGESEQALTLLAQADAGAYAASYAIARGDALLALGRSDEAREAYAEALALSAQAAGQVNLVMLQQKIQSLSSIPASATAPVEGEVAEVQAVATPAIATETENDTLEQAEPAAAEE